MPYKFTQSVYLFVTVLSVFVMPCVCIQIIIWQSNIIIVVIHDQQPSDQCLLVVRLNKTEAIKQANACVSNFTAGEKNHDF